MEKKQRAASNTFKDGTASQENYALRVVGYKVCALLWVVSNRQNHWLYYILHAVKNTNQCLCQKPPKLFNRKDIGTPHIINNLAENPILGCFASPSIFTGLGAIRLPLFPFGKKFFEREGCKSALGDAFSPLSHKYFMNAALWGWWKEEKMSTMPKVNIQLIKINDVVEIIMFYRTLK